MQFTADEKFNLFGLTAAIMHMGEMKFKQRPREEQAECEDQSGKFLLVLVVLFLQRAISPANFTWSIRTHLSRRCSSRASRSDPNGSIRARIWTRWGMPVHNSRL